MAEMAHFAKFAFAPDEVNDLTPTVICERVQEGAEMDEAAKVNIRFGQGSACSIPLSTAFVSLLASILGSNATPLSARGPQTVNPYLDADQYVSPVYADQVVAAAATIRANGDNALADKALLVAEVPTFLWIDRIAAVTSIGGYLQDARTKQAQTARKQVVNIEVYNLPDRDCSAKASSGELDISQAGLARYESYIKAIGSQIESYPDVTIVIGLETDSVGNLVSNQSVPKCANAAEAHINGSAFAVAWLSQYANVSIYLDGAHAAWLGWPDNLGPTADILAEIVNRAKVINPAAAVRGVATNVSNYNGLGTSTNYGYDELDYVRNLAPLLTARGLPAHFIVDQGRSGQQDYPRSGGDWCNNKQAGFGPRPSSITPDPLIDAIVWVKPGGQGDGTSDETAERFDEACGSETSLKPAPEAGAWFQEYFEQLLENANPPF
ncbi:glycoside hydrolase family 6 protein [Pleurotus ostreatus PC15]|uniref:Glucanase n=1 Tax=Pleurotus ostreatus (strain PC15) TaxID=1137138 RepID=A0A067NQE2_PLEO1|nr:glycoside hydrolase family 6 protein [Pleurotus ostreatus PC15]